MAGTTKLSFTMTKAKLMAARSLLPNVASKRTDAYAMSSVHSSIEMRRK
jgi:hypothetical protein